MDEVSAMSWHHDSHGKEWKVISAVKDAEAAILSDASAKFINTIQDVKDAETRMTSQIVQNRFDTERGFGRANDAIDHVGEEVAEGIGDIKSAVGDYSREIERLVQSGTNQLGVQSERIGGELIRQVQLTSDNSQRLTQLVGDNIQRLVQGTANATDTLILTNSNILGAQAERNAAAAAIAFKDVQLLQERLAAQAAADAARYAAAAAAQLCECCCELKEKIGADGDETRELLNAMKQQDLRDQLAAAQARLVEERHAHQFESVFNKVTQVGAGNVAIPTAVRS